MALRVRRPVKLWQEPRDDAARSVTRVRQDYRITVEQEDGEWCRIDAVSSSSLIREEGWIKANLLFDDGMVIVEKIDVVAYLRLLSFLARSNDQGLKFRDYLGAVAWLKSGIRNLIEDKDHETIGPFQFTVSQWSVLSKRYDLDLIPEDIVDPGDQAAVAAALSTENLVELTELFERLSQQVGGEVKGPNSADLYLADLLGLEAAKAVLKAGKLQTINQPLEEVYEDENDTRDFVGRILQRHGDIMLENGDPKTIEKTLADLILRFDEAYAALKPHIEQLPDDVRTSPNAGASLATLGQLSRKYETGGRGPETVSTGEGDPGGVSYGSYQMSTNRGTAKEFVTQAAFPWRARFIAEPGTEAFSDAWKALAAEEPQRFFAAQHAFIKRTHFDPLVKHIASDHRLDLTSGSRALQEVTWSTAVQHGTGDGAEVFREAIQKASGGGALQPGDLESDRRLIQAVYAERGREDGAKLAHFSRVTDHRTRESLKKRFVDEERDALAMLA